MTAASQPAGPPAQPRRRLVVTPVLIALNVAVFGAMVALGVSAVTPDEASLLKFGANSGIAVVLDGEWWRAFTYMFVHIGFVHLLVNMYSLWNVGGFVERLLGGWLYLLVYLLTGFAGAFSSVMWNPFGISAGASGAIFGLFGVVIGFTFRAREQLPPQTFYSLRSGILATLLFNLLFALNVPYLDHAAHLGGLSVGVLSGVVATASAIERQRRASWASQLIVLATVVGLAVLAETRTRNQPRVKLEVQVHRARVAAHAGRWADAEREATGALGLRDDPRARVLRAQAYLKLQRPVAALADLDAAVPMLDRDDDREPELADALELRGSVLLEEGDYSRGIADLRRVVKLVPDDARPKNNLAWALIRVGGAEAEALSLADQAAQAEPDAAVLGTRCFALVANGKPDEAKADCEAAVKANDSDLVDEGMLRYIAHDWAGALELWDQAGQASSTNARDLVPWVERARRRLATAPAQPDAP